MEELVVPSVRLKEWLELLLSVVTVSPRRGETYREETTMTRPAITRKLQVLDSHGKLSLLTDQCSESLTEIEMTQQ